jgi:16S rRNA (cytidine1402-2'-O)-methyltransferase
VPRSNSRAGAGSASQPGPNGGEKAKSGPKGIGAGAESQRLAASLAPGLHVVATPIGNLGDLTQRAAATLASADQIACEDTRITAKLLRHYGIDTPITAYHEHNAERVRPALIERLEAGATIALVSDAGTPLISDPGYKLVRAARQAGIPVMAVPGASAVTAALSIAGLPTDRFMFAGFPPSKPGARRTFYAELAGVPASLVVFEAPSRLAASLADAAAQLGRREAAVARELTKRFEEVNHGPLADLAERYAAADRPKGEIVIVFGPPEPARQADVSGGALDARLRAALAGQPVKAAAEQVAAATGQSKRALYQRALALKAQDDDG